MRTWTPDSGRFTPIHVRLGPSRFRLAEHVRIDLPYLPMPDTTETRCQSHALYSADGSDPDKRRCLATIRSKRLTIWAGFVWDGASGPTWDTEGIRCAALIHDALYRLLAMRVLPIEHRETADRIFYHFLRVNGVNFLRRWYYFLGVRWFGASSATAKGNERALRNYGH